nr:hypothetical protein [Pseudomonas tremae]
MRSNATASSASRSTHWVKPSASVLQVSYWPPVERTRTGCPVIG